MRSSFVNELSSYLSSRSESSNYSSLKWVIQTNQDVDLIDNVILYGFENDYEEPSVVAKVPRLAENGRLLQVEYDRLIEVWNRLGDEAGLFIPRPIGIVTLGTHSALVTSYLQGESLTGLSRVSFWKNEERVYSLVVDAATLLRKLNNRMSMRLLPGEKPAMDIQLKVDTFRRLFPTTEKEDQRLTDLVDFSSVAMLATTHKVLLQGDFWHGNTIRGKENGQLMLIDWQFAHWSVDVSMDVYLFLLAAALEAAPYGDVEHRAQGAASVLLEWLPRIVPAYLKTYGHPEGYVLLPLRHGLLSCCVEKVVRSALDFGYNHPDDLMWRYLFAQLLDWPEVV